MRPAWLDCEIPGVELRREVASLEENRSSVRSLMYDVEILGVFN